MNYEELLESRNGAALSRQSVPFGCLYKKMIDGKYVNVVNLRDDLKDNLVFTDALVSEAERNKTLNHIGQIHFSPLSDSVGIYGVSIDQGGFHTFRQLLDDNPAIVAQKNFVSKTLKNLFAIVDYLHGKGIYHICFSPDNVFARKGDNEVMLLFHGSAYQAMHDQQELYGESAAFIAPEVLEEGVFDQRADIYSIGKFIEFLFRQSEVPLELKGVIKRATALNPDKRYQSVDEMQSAIVNRRNTRNSIVMAVAALVIVAICFGLYFTLVPEREDIEFVKAAPKESEDDLLDDGFDPMTEMGVVVDTTSTHIDQHKLREYQAKAEQIFRKNFAREADRILSKIYTSENMHETEKNFMVGSRSTMEELVKVQKQLGHDAGLNESRSQLLAGQIIDQITARLKKEMADKSKNQE